MVFSDMATIPVACPYDGEEVMVVVPPDGEVVAVTPEYEVIGVADDCVRAACSDCENEFFVWYQ